LLSDHYTPLVLAYLVGLSGWLLASYVFAGVWPREPAPVFERPLRELGIALGGVVGVVAVGQVWASGIHLPEQGALGPTLGAVNHILIFTPLLLVPVIRRQPWTTAWLPRTRVPIRLLVGVVLAALAVGAYSLLRDGADAPWVLFGRIWRYEHIDEMTQVFLEDLAVAILFVRLAGAIGNRWATVLVACLFAAGHIPALVSQGVSQPELLELFRDVGLGVVVILVLQKSRDVLWFWCIHFCLDMTQFARISGIG
jgi:hypothetical protein